MRQRFEQQMSLRTIAISDVQFPLKSRDELPPILMALQYIFITPELNEKVFSLLENKVCGGKKDGQKGDGSVAYTGTCRCSQRTGKQLGFACIGRQS